MKKALLTFFIFFAVITICYPSFGFDFGQNNSIIISGYDDYAPIGYLNKDKQFNSVFQPLLEDLARRTNKALNFRLYNVSATEAIEYGIRTGKTDIFLGGYSQTSRFENLHLLFPAVTHNPITFFVLPSRSASVRSFDDLKTLKGIRYSKELFSDFVEKNLKDYNLEVTDSTYELFEKLFTRKVDYILSGYYFGMIEAIKLGVSHQIAVSKQPLFNIPLFIGVVSISPRHDMLVNAIIPSLQDENFVALVKENFKHMIEYFEKEYAGVVPPTFGLENEPTLQDTASPITPITNMEDLSSK